MSGASRKTTALLLASTALLSAGAAIAQEVTDTVVVRGTFIPDEKRDTSEISSVLDTQDYQAQGDGDIAAALTRITGITLARDKYVYVRGLNERYSNVTLNGATLPSPEPLRRVAPLDLFPTALLSSTVVQKTYSPEYGGEFGGGLIALRTATLPAEDFFEMSVSTAFDTETTLQEGLTYYGGGDPDYTGWDDGERNLPEPLAEIFDTQRVGTTLPTDQQQEIGRSLANSSLWVIQEVQNIEPDFGASVSAGKIIPAASDVDVGILFAGGYSNAWTTKVGLTGQGGLTGGALVPNVLSERFSTEQEIRTNGLLTLGVDFLDTHELKFTGLGVRSTVKGARTSEVVIGGTASGGIIDFDRRDKLDWFERQVWLGQLEGSHMFPALHNLQADWRVSYAEAMRDAPYQREVSYRCVSPTAAGAPAGRQPECDLAPTSDGFTPGLWAYGGRQSDNLTQFSKVEDINRDYGADFVLPVFEGERSLDLKAGAAYQLSDRDAFVRQFRYSPGGSGIPASLLFSRIDHIFADSNIYDARLRLVETGGLGFPEAYRASMEVQAFYAGFEAQVTPYISIALGGRQEESTQITDTYNATLTDNGVVETTLEEDYFLPAGTLTWNFADDLQFRLGASKTITRPQFRELAFAEFFDTETEQNFRGNPFLVNTEVKNYDARLEYYFGRDQFITVGAFYKDLENPIEEYALQLGDTLASSFINVPSATLWGGEFEFEKILPLQQWFGMDGASWMDDKDFVFKTNYTYTNSEVSADGDVTLAQQATLVDIVPNSTAASGFIVDGRELQGASEHIFNAQFGYRSESSTLNLLVNYASERIRQVEDLSNGLPAVMEKPPVTVDLVYLRDITVRGGEFEFGVRVQNILDEDYKAFQEADGVVVPVDTYDIGQTVSLSLKRRF